MRNSVIHGCVPWALKAVPDKHVQCCVTSPPYWGLRDYGIEPVDWPAVEFAPIAGLPVVKVAAQKAVLGLEDDLWSFVGHIVLVFREVWRVMRDDAVLWLNMGDSYAACGSGSDGKELAYMGEAATRRQARRPKASGLKPKDLVGQPWLLAKALQADGWFLRSDVIWCLSGGAHVYVRGQKGDMPMMIRDLVRLKPRSVQLWNGKAWTRYMGYREATSRAGALEIELRSGERIGCTPGHEWPTQRGLVAAAGLAVGDVIHTCSLPQPEADCPHNIPPNVGWVVGHYLAEGSRSGTTIQIACHADEEPFVRRQWAEFAQSYGGSTHSHTYRGKGRTVCVEGRAALAIIDTYIAGRTAKDKHLTTAAWNRESLFLDYVRRGYIYGDGHYEENNNRWRLGFTRNDHLAADLRTLAARLGHRVRLRACFANIGEKRYPAYRGEWRCSTTSHHNTKPNGEIVAIRASRARRFYDIAVEDAPHLFSLASGVLTHNSKPNPMPESCRDRPTKSHEHVFLLTKQGRYFYDADAVREAGARDGDGCGKWSAARTNAPGDGRAPVDRGARRPDTATGRNLRDVWTIATQGFPDAHFATFPEKLIEPCIKAGTSERGACAKCGAGWERVTEKGALIADGHAKHLRPHAIEPNLRDVADKGWSQEAGFMPNACFAHTTTGWRPSCECEAGEPVPAIVLDPFGGSGTTAAVAYRLGRDYVLCEANADYLPMIAKRVGKVSVPLFEHEEEEGDEEA